MLKNGFAKITLLLLGSVALTSMAQAQSTTTAPVWPSSFQLPKASQAPEQQSPEDVLAQPFTEPELSVAPIEEPLVDPFADGTLGGTDAPFQAEEAGVEAAPVVETVVEVQAEPVVEAAAEVAAPVAEVIPAAAGDVADVPVSDVATYSAPPDDAVVIEGWQRRIAGPAGAGRDSLENLPEHAKGEDPDPVLTEMTDLVRESGLIARQSEMSEGLLLMERQLQFANNVNQMIGILGPDVQIEIAPGVFKSYADTPAGRKAAAEMARLEQELVAQQLDWEHKQELKRREIEEDLAVEEEPEQGAEGALLPPRSDGGEFQDLGGGAVAQPGDAAALQAQIRQQVEAMVEERLAAVEPEPEPSPALSLRQVFGGNGEYVAVLNANGERVRVRSGDDLPGGIKVMAVGEDYVEIETNGVSSRLSIRG